MTPFLSQSFCVLKNDDVAVVILYRGEDTAKQKVIQCVSGDFPVTRERTS